jgi:ABC-type Mn2+/Zn2+ transport system permease subunit
VSLLTEPFAYAFFTRALLAGVLIGGMCGALSVFVVLRRMSYIGHGLAHSVLGGVAVGAALGWGIYPGAVVATLVSAVLIDRVARQRGLHADAAIGIVTTAMFALGIVVVSTSGSSINTEAILFGNVLGVTTGDLWLAAACAAGFALALFTLYKPLVFVAFDPEVARVSAVRAGAVEALINLLTAAVVIVSVRVLGVLLIAAAVVIPGALARLVTRSFGRMLAVATGVGATSGVVGLYASFHVDIPSGPAIVLVAASLFGFALVVRSVAGRGGIRRARVAAARGDGLARPTSLP